MSRATATLENIQDDIDRLLVSIFTGVMAHGDYAEAAALTTTSTPGSDVADRDAIVAEKARLVAEAHATTIGHINSLGGIGMSRHEQNIVLLDLSNEYERKKASVLLLDQKLALLSARVDRSLEEVNLYLTTSL